MNEDEAIVVCSRRRLHERGAGRRGGESARRVAQAAAWRTRNERRGLARARAQASEQAGGRPRDRGLGGGVTRRRSRRGARARGGGTGARVHGAPGRPSLCPWPARRRGGARRGRTGGRAGGRRARATRRRGRRRGARSRRRCSPSKICCRQQGEAPRQVLDQASLLEAGSRLRGALGGASRGQRRRGARRRGGGGRAHAPLRGAEVRGGGEALRSFRSGGRLTR